MRYRDSARFDDELEIAASLTRLGSTSITTAFTIERVARRRAAHRGRAAPRVRRSADSRQARHARAGARSGRRRARRSSSATSARARSTPIQTVFNPSDPHPVAATTDYVYGVISLIFWSVTIVVTVTVRAARDARRQRRRGRHHGADHADPAPALARRRAHEADARRARDLRRLAVLRRQHDHPAISVLSAVEGLKVV